jgi:hypothetical protein
MSTSLQVWHTNVLHFCSFCKPTISEATREWDALYKLTGMFVCLHIYIYIYMYIYIYILGSWERKAVAWWRWFEPGSDDLITVVDKEAVEQVFSEYSCFPCQSFHRLLHAQHHLRTSILETVFFSYVNLISFFSIFRFYWINSLLYLAIILLCFLWGF